MKAFFLDTIDSTNDEARRLIRRGELCESAYVLAREQTAGRGSRGRSWASPRDAGIYLSVIEIPGEREIAPTTLFTLATGVACVETLYEVAGVTALLKPVNDLYVDGRKLGGILIETVVRSDKLEALVIGVGINVRPATRTLPVGSVEAVCLADIMLAPRFAPLDMSELVAVLVARIHRWTAIAFAGRVAEVCHAWDRHKIPGATIPTIEP